MSESNDSETCRVCGADVEEPCRKGPGITGDGMTSCGDGLTNIIIEQGDREETS